MPKKKEVYHNYYVTIETPLAVYLTFEQARKIITKHPKKSKKYPNGFILHIRRETP